jgi:hypothetical protein
MTMGRVHVEVIAANQNVFRVRRLENDEAFRPQYPQRLIQQRNQRVECNMLDDVKAGDRADATIIQTSEMNKKIFFRDVQASVTTLRNLNSICIYAMCFNPRCTQNLQPLAAPAAKIDDCRLFFDVRQVNFEAFLDLVAITTKSIFERCV